MRPAHSPLCFSEPSRDCPPHPLHGSHFFPHAFKQKNPFSSPPTVNTWPTPPSPAVTAPSRKLPQRPGQEAMVPASLGHQNGARSLCRLTRWCAFTPAIFKRCVQPGGVGEGGQTSRTTEGSSYPGVPGKSAPAPNPTQRLAKQTPFSEASVTCMSLWASLTRWPSRTPPPNRANVFLRDILVNAIFSVPRVPCELWQLHCVGGSGRLSCLARRLQPASPLPVPGFGATDLPCQTMTPLAHLCTSAAPAQSAGTL